MKFIKGLFSNFKQTDEEKLKKVEAAIKPQVDQYLSDAFVLLMPIVAKCNKSELPKTTTSYDLYCYWRTLSQKKVNESLSSITKQVLDFGLDQALYSVDLIILATLSDTKLNSSLKTEIIHKSLPILGVKAKDFNDFINILNVA